MGNVVSTGAVGRKETTRVSDSVNMNCVGASSDNLSNDSEEQFHDADSGDEESRLKVKEDALQEFKKELAVKREQRKAILQRHREEKDNLEKNLSNEIRKNFNLNEDNRALREILIRNNIEIPENLKCDDVNVSDAIESMREQVEKLRENNIKLRRNLSESNVTLQNAFSDIADLTEQNTESIKHINALKEVISVSKTMISLREQQLMELKNKLSEIERSLADREANMLSVELRQEYERQLENIRTLRSLYEERARLAEVTRQNILRELEEQKSLNETEINNSIKLKEQIDTLESEINNLKETIEGKDDQIMTCKQESYNLKEEMAVVNKLFSQVLLGYKNKQNLDKLVHRLEENHGLLTQMAENEDGTESSSALPKLLLEIVSQVDAANEKSVSINDDKNIVKENNTENIEEPTNATPAEIVENLPKVWRVLMELLSHQNSPDTNSGGEEKVTTCYKSVETKSGPVLVPSVSQTYIRLKDLIMEKLALVKEVNRMKQLNTHLESRLGEQESRLCLVSTELSKTWHVVGRLRRHHHQLHTHEKILKYELQQKRKLLNELKGELEYCREKCDQAREKNSQSEKDWNELRADFSSRKLKSHIASCNNSAESGYSDERPSDDSSESNDESEYLNEPLITLKKKFKKSFETIHDSSNDCNHAEREDPVSDMIDVADLPLDAHDSDENEVISMSECGDSESVSQNDNILIETEDEVGDVENESCADESKSEMKQNVLKNNLSSSIIKPIDPASILESIKRQKERLAKRDKRLNDLETKTASLLIKAKNTALSSEQIDNTLNHIINRPSSSRSSDEEMNKTENSSFISKVKQEADDILIIDTALTEGTLCNSPSTSTSCDPKGSLIIKKNIYENTNDLRNLVSVNASFTSNNEIESNAATLNALSSNDNKVDKDSNQKNIIDYPRDAHIESNEPLIDPATILENIKKQNDRLAEKDRKLNAMESDTKDILNKAKNTVKKGEIIKDKIDGILNKPSSSNTVDDICITPSCSENTNESKLSNDISKKDFKENTEFTTEIVSNETDEKNVNKSSSEAQDTAETKTDSSLRAQEASTSDHEARFAARDVRLKLLEEQTKSLVNRVNKTATKGIKLHYKLEELHNIYGSENSRAGTPSEGNEDNTEDDEEST